MLLGASFLNPHAQSPTKTCSLCILTPPRQSASSATKVSGLGEWPPNLQVPFPQMRSHNPAWDTVLKCNSNDAKILCSKHFPSLPTVLQMKPAVLNLLPQALLTPAPFGSAAPLFSSLTGHRSCPSSPTAQALSSLLASCMHLTMLGERSFPNLSVESS